MKNLTFTSPPLTFLFLFSITFFSCETNFVTVDEDDERGLSDPNAIIVGEATRAFPEVDERLWIYFERFEDAGNERGRNVDLAASHVTGSIKDLENQNAPGTCAMNTSGTMHHINLSPEFWEMATDGQKEVMIFHELGHCYLKREHVDAADPNGFCISLMRTGGGDCRDNYNLGTREEFLDELFDL